MIGCPTKQAKRQTVWAFVSDARGPINNRLQVSNLPRIAASRKRVQAFVSDAKRPINNRPQVTDLPHKIVAACSDLNG